ncbi:hypothetical protein TNCV_2903941 [Trichonephila clavipes]|nr:hypothetical protein TNCV_2903941 [Trichonephila clavipes]
MSQFFRQTHSVKELMSVKCVVAQIFPVGEVEKYGDEVPLQLVSSSLDRGYKLQANSSRVALECDVDEHSLPS